MSNFKRKKVAAAAFTFLMALSSISGATIVSPDLDGAGNQDEDALDSEMPIGYSAFSLNPVYLNYQNLVEKHNPGLDHFSRDKIYKSAAHASLTYNIPIELILAIIASESEFKPGLYGSLDDSGLMQIRYRFASSWAKSMGVEAPASQEELTDIDYNIKMGTFILKYLLDTFDGDLERALVAYNAGEFYVKKKLLKNEGLPKTYIKRVNSFYQQIVNAAI